jgi:hypothetical protein
MPPRKRTQNPSNDGHAESPTLDGETGQDPADDSSEQPDTPSEKPTPARSDLQHVQQPCPECFPSGWPDQASAVGCTHGTFVRD